MKQSILNAIIINTITGFALICCTDAPEVRETFTPKDIELSRSEATINDEANGFAIRLFNEMAKTNYDKNFVLSPFGMTVCMSMVANATDDNTSASIRELFDFQSIDELNSYCHKMLDALPYLSADCHLTTANSVWYKDYITPKTDFVASMSENFDADILPMNKDCEAAATEINRWCFDHTNGAFKSVISPADLAKAQTYLANAVAFRAKWNQPFKTQDTKQETFHGVLGDATVQMMHLSATASYYKAETWECALKAYKDKAFSMIIIKPTEGNSLSEVAASISLADIDCIFISGETCTLNLAMPKFTTDTDAEYQDMLAEMGASLPFIRLDKLTDKRFEDPIYLKVKQNALIEVDEEGTVAAAVSGALATTYGPNPKKIDFRLDQPFIYFIRNTKTGSIIFAGQYVNG